jgi:iron complex transport system substrate-binding protein
MFYWESAVKYRRYFAATIILLLATLFFACAQGDKQNQYAGRRIISLSPHITEIIYRLNAQDELYAVSDYCRYPLQARDKEKIGGLIDPNIEKIISLKPTHIFGVPAHHKLDGELEKFGLSVTMLPNENITHVLATIDSLGVILNRTDHAERLIKSIEDSLSTIKSHRVPNGPTAMLVIGRERGTLRNITVAGDDTFISEVWQLAGGKNIFSDLASRYSSINLETLLTRDPDIIIEFDVSGPRIVKNISSESVWSDLHGLTAVTQENVFLISGSHTLIPGPRLLMLAQQFEQIIHQLKLL